MNNVIELIAKEFNKENVTWAIGGSFLLQRYGINDGSKELDIMVSTDSIEKANEIMNAYSLQLEVSNDNHFQTDSFNSYQIENLTINIIGNLKCDFNESFAYQFDKNDISSVDMSDKEKIYYSHMLDWFVIYQELNNVKTTNLIEEYYNKGAFLDNTRLELKFGRIDIPNVKNSISSFKKRIYQVG